MSERVDQIARPFVIEIAKSAAFLEKSLKQPKTFPPWKPFNSELTKNSPWERDKKTNFV